MSVRELLSRKSGQVISVEANASVAAAARLMMRHGIGGLPVVRDGTSVVGFVSERELVAVLDRRTGYVRSVPVSLIMRAPAPFCRTEDGIPSVMERMTRERLRHLVVMDGDRLAGVISVGDLVKHRLDQLELETGVLRDYVAGQRARR